MGKIWDWLTTPVFKPAPPKGDIIAPPERGYQSFDARVYEKIRRMGQPSLYAGQFAICYVEGMDPDGTKNDNAPNEFSDTRILLQMTSAGFPKIIGRWEATTEPGKFWTQHRMNPAGAFHIRLGYQACWQMGEYHGPALVQAAKIEGFRDSNNQMRRAGPIYRGEFGVHHHGGYDMPKGDIGRTSAGCQVGRSVAGHAQFMSYLRTDPRYMRDRGFMFGSTVLSYDQLMN